MGSNPSLECEYIDGSTLDLHSDPDLYLVYQSVGNRFTAENTDIVASCISKVIQL